MCIAVLGSVVTAVCRSGTDGRGGNSLGGDHSGAQPDVLAQAREAFTSGFHLAAAITAVALAAMAVLLAVTLRALPALSPR